MNTTTKAEGKQKTAVKVLHIPVYDFDGLDESAKEKARDWYRNGALDFDWWNSTYEDAATIGLKITSFELDRGRHCEGEFKYFGGAEQCARLILKEHGDKCETYKTAKKMVVHHRI